MSPAHSANTSATPDAGHLEMRCSTATAIEQMPAEPGADALARRERRMRLG
jgi:hypothetical protein